MSDTTAKEECTIGLLVDAIGQQLVWAATRPPVRQGELVLYVVPADDGLRALLENGDLTIRVKKVTSEQAAAMKATATVPKWRGELEPREA